MGFFEPLKSKVGLNEILKTFELTLHGSERNDKVLHASVHGDLGLDGAFGLK
jgi:hypothetical protein